MTNPIILDETRKLYYSFVEVDQTGNLKPHTPHLKKNGNSLVGQPEFKYADWQGIRMSFFLRYTEEELSRLQKISVRPRNL